MTDNRKEQEREELHRTIWNIANDLRGSVDGWDFKQYVLGNAVLPLYFGKLLQTTSTQASARPAMPTSTTPSCPTSEAEQAREDLMQDKGLFHPAQPAVLPTSAPGRAAGREPERDAGGGLHAH